MFRGDGECVEGSWGAATRVRRGLEGEDLAFTVTRRRFNLGLFNLPPAEEGEEKSEKEMSHILGP